MHAWVQSRYILNPVVPERIVPCACGRPSSRPCMMHQDRFATHVRTSCFQSTTPCAYFYRGPIYSMATYATHAKGSDHETGAPPCTFSAGLSFARPSACGRHARTGLASHRQRARGLSVCTALHVRTYRPSSLAIPHVRDRPRRVGPARVAHTCISFPSFSFVLEVVVQ